MKHIYTNGTDSVIAVSERDAATVWEHYVGETYESTWDKWEMVPDENYFHVLFDSVRGEILIGETVVPPGATILHERDEDGEPISYPYTHEVIARAGDWARVNKKHFLCSTEW